MADIVDSNATTLTSELKESDQGYITDSKRGPQRLLPNVYTQGGMVRVIVGPEKVHFTIHKELFSKHSSFFDACFGQDFKERTKSEVELPEDSPHAFGIVVDWIYLRGALVGEIDNQETVNDYIDAYVLADKFMMHHCKNDIIDRIRKYTKQVYMDGKTVTRLTLYDMDLSSPLCRFFIEQYAFDMWNNPSGFLSHEDLVLCENGRSSVLEPELMIEILQELLRILHLQTSYTPPVDREACFYHDHQSSECDDPSCSSAASKK